ncbi:MAG: hypothetical protein U0232_32770 [Thermomicrobiales bacterium]
MTFPMLIFTVPAIQANATSSVAVCWDGGFDGGRIGASCGSSGQLFVPMAITASLLGGGWGRWCC